MLRSLGILIVICLTSLENFGQFTNLKFENYDTPDGLSSSTCVEIFQDSDGFLWFGTIDGLNRFDGYEFQVFRPEPNNNFSLSNNRINDIIEDQQGYLWIATANGLNVYDRYSEKFIKIDFPSHVSKEKNAVFINTLYYERAHDRVWVGTRNGVYSILKSKNFKDLMSIQQSIVLEEHFRDVSDKNVVSIEGFESKIYFLSQDGDFKSYNALLNETQEGFSYSINDISWLSHLPKQMALTNTGMLWLGNDLAHLSIYNPFTQSLIKLKSIDKHIPIFDIYSDLDGRIWISTDGNGLYLYSADGKLIQHFINEASNPFSIANDQPSKVLQDDNGIYWIATYNKGINKLNPSKSSFGHIFYQPGVKNGLSTKIAQSVLADGKNRIWIGTDGGGVNLFKPNENRFVQYNTGNSDLSSDKILFLASAENEGLWVCTWDGGLNFFDIVQNTFKNFKHDPNNSKSIGENTVWCAVEDSRGRVWLGTQTAGLNFFDPQAEEFFKYEANPVVDGGLNSNFVFSLFIDSKQRLFVGTALGIQYLELDKLETLVPNSIQLKDLDVESINANRTNYITEDHKGNIWVGTDMGLYKYDNDLALVKSYTRKDGLPNNLIVGVQEDNQGKLWITSKGGLSYLNPENGFIQNFNLHDGIQGLEFQSKSIDKTTDGKIIAGGINGVNLFDPKKINIKSSFKNPIITQLSFFNKKIEVGDTINGRVLLKHPIVSTPDLDLKYYENYLSFEYVALNIDNPNRIKYRYKLDDLDKEFIAAGENRIASYSNLAPGKYDFIVMAAIDGNWEKAKVTHLKFTIATPPWLTWWAYLIYGLMVVGLIMVFIYYYTILIKRNKERELDQLKMKFFMNVSHEFRTPLTLILNPVDKILSRFQEPDQVQASALTIQKSARRLLHLINQLLDFRKIDMGGDPLQLYRVDIVELSRDIFGLFKDLATESKIEMKFESQYSTFIMQLDPDKYEKILSNLLSNALKFTPGGGKVKLSINDSFESKSAKTGFPLGKKKEEYIKIVVSDTGIGFKKEQLGEAFSRFFHVDKSRTGTGIGLNFTKALVDMHQGEIWLESEYKKGSAFNIILPTCRKNSLYQLHKLGSKSFSLKETLQTTVKAVEYEMAIQNSVEHTPENALKDRDTKTLLIVEDNRELRVHLKNELEQYYNIKEARDGEVGLKKVRKYLPDLIISDVMMPAMDGFELCRQVKTNLETCHIPVILLTARSLEEDKIEGYETGADEYLPKPFNIYVLKARIKNLLEAKKRLREKFTSMAGIVPSSELTSNTMDEAFLDKSTKIILNNIGDSDFSIENLVKELGMGRSNFYRKINSITGQNPSHFIRTIRLKYAAELLLKSELSIKEIAYQCGFNSSAYFTKTFKELYGDTPSDYVGSHKTE